MAGRTVKGAVLWLFPFSHFQISLEMWIHKISYGVHWQWDWCQDLQIRVGIFWSYMALDTMIKATEDQCFHPLISMTSRAVFGQGPAAYISLIINIPPLPWCQAFWSSCAWRHGSSSGNIAINWNDPTIPKETYSCLRSFRGRAIAEDRKKIVENNAYSVSESAQDWMGDCSDFPKLHKFI